MFRKKILKKSFTAVLFYLIFLAPALAWGKQFTVAVIPGQGDRDVGIPFISQLETLISQRAEVKLLERSLIRDVLHEQLQSVSGFATNVRYAIRLGKLLSADFLVFAEKISYEDNKTYRIRIVESQTGVVLFSWLTGDHLQPQDADRIIKAVAASIKKKEIGSDDRRYVGILGFKSEELGTALDGVSEGLKAFLSENLAQLKDVVILDREHLQYLQQERSLTGLELKLKSSAVVIEAGIRYGPEQKNLEVTLNFYPLDGQKRVQTVSFPVALPGHNLDAARQALLHVVLKQLKIQPVRTAPVDAQVEAELFTRQVLLLLKSGEYDLAVRNAEVALALNPSQETRYWASRSWYLLSRSLRVFSMTFFSEPFMPAGRADVQAVTLGKNTEPSASRPEDELAGEKPDNRRVERSYGRYHSDPAQLERMLSALTRSYALIEEITREHMAAAQPDIIPDPLERLPVFDTRKPSREKPPLASVLGGYQDPRIQKFLVPLISVSFNYLKMQRDFYAQHYARSRNIQEAYWNTWKKEKEFISDYYGFLSKEHIRMIQQVCDAFVQFQKEDFEPRMKGITESAQLSPNKILSDEETAFYQSLMEHVNPFLRLLAHKQLLRNDPSPHAREIAGIFSRYFADDTSVWNMEDADFFPEFLRSAIHRLAVADQDALIKDGEHIFKRLLKKETARHLLAWQARDVFWPYVNVLVLKGQTVKAREVVEQAIDILEGNLLLQSSRDVKVFRLRLDLMLVRLGIKKEIDKSLTAYASYIGTPSYIRMRPELEPPHLGEAIDMSVFSPTEEIRRKGMHTTTFSKSSCRSGEEGQGEVFTTSFTRTVDAEGNEQYIFYHIDAEEEKKKEFAAASASGWDQYIIQTLPSKVAAAAMLDHPDLRRAQKIVLNNYLMDGSHLYILKDWRENENIFIRAYVHDLSKTSQTRHLGTASVPVTNAQTFNVTAIASGPRELYVGTPNGVLIFDKTAGEMVPEGRLAPSGQASTDAYEPYYSRRNFKTTEKAVVGKIQHLSETTGFLGNRVLSLAYHKGQLYIGIGPEKESEMGPAGKCGLAVFDVQKGTYEILASSKSLKRRHFFERGDIYRIDKILVDPKDDLLWLAVGGNPELNGIWKFDIRKKKFFHMAQEDMDIQDMQRTEDGKIIYVMYGSGIASFDPKTGTKTWLLGYIVSVWSGPDGPVAPKGIGGDPVHGYPRTRLWPSVVDGEHIFTLSWDTTKVLLHEKGKAVSEKAIFNPNNTFIAQKRYLAKTADGILVVTDEGIYLIKSQKR